MDNKEQQEKKGELMAKKFIRATGAILDGTGNIIIHKQDLIDWFKSGSYLNEASEYDSI